MKFRSLDRMVEGVRSLAYISVLDVLQYKQFTVHMKKAYQSLSRRRATRMD